ncbi:MAG: hypothetical protein JXR07_19060 [Reichenbachiella sp.]
MKTYVIPEADFKCSLMIKSTVNDGFDENQPFALPYKVTPVPSGSVKISSKNLIYPSR